MDDLTDHEQELVAAARQTDDPTVVEAEVPERLSEHEELIDEAEALEEPTVVETTDHEALRERVETVEEMLAEALQERTGLSDEAIDAMPFEALASEFETDDGDLDVDALTQSPETGSDPSDDGDGDGDTPDEEILEKYDASDREEAVEVLQKRHANFEANGWESHREEAEAELEALGVDVE